MSEKIYPVSAAWAKRAFVDDAEVQGDVRALGRRTRTASGASTASASTGSSRSPRSRTRASIRTTSRSNGSRTACTNVAVQLHRPPSRQARRPDGDHLGRRRSRASRSTITYRELHEQVVPLRQRAEGARRQEGRPRHDLHADDPRGRLRDARLRAHRRGPFGRLRRLLAGLARRPHRGLRSRRSSSPPTRACAAAARCRSRPMSTRRSTRPASSRRDRRASAPAARSTWNAGRDVWYARGGGEGAGRLPARADERGGPAVHPLHLGLDRRAQGRRCTRPAAISSTRR